MLRRSEQESDRVNQDPPSLRCALRKTRTHVLRNRTPAKVKTTNAFCQKQAQASPDFEPRCSTARASPTSTGTSPTRDSSRGFTTLDKRGHGVQDPAAMELRGRRNRADIDRRPIPDRRGRFKGEASSVISMRSPPCFSRPPWLDVGA